MSRLELPRPAFRMDLPRTPAVPRLAGLGATGFDGWSKAGAACRGGDDLVNPVAVGTTSADANYALAA